LDSVICPILSAVAELKKEDIEKKSIFPIRELNPGLGLERAIS
jgi:hypothetical protein